MRVPHLSGKTHRLLPTSSNKSVNIWVLILKTQLQPQRLWEVKETPLLDDIMQLVELT